MKQALPDDGMLEHGPIGGVQFLSVVIAGISACAVGPWLSTPAESGAEIGPMVIVFAVVWVTSMAIGLHLAHARRRRSMEERGEPIPPLWPTHRSGHDRQARS